MLLPSPKRYSQSFRARRLTDYARRTVDSILGKMVQANYISEEERDRLTQIPLSFEDPAAVDGGAEPAADSEEKPLAEEENFI